MKTNTANEALNKNQELHVIKICEAIHTKTTLVYTCIYNPTSPAFLACKQCIEAGKPGDGANTRI